MKYTAAGTPSNNMNQNQTRQYVSISPKFASATYSEGFNKQYNSPKTAVSPAKGFVVAKPNNENIISTFTKQQKNNSFLSQNKSKAARGPVILLGNDVHTPKALVSSTVSNQALGLNNGKGNPIKKADSLRTVSSTPKSSNSYRPSEATKTKEDSSYSGHYKWKKLEISTEFNGKTSYGNKAQTTKHTEPEEDLRENMKQLSQSVVKSGSARPPSSSAYGPYSPAGKDAKQKNGRPISSSDANLRSSSSSAARDSKPIAHQTRAASSNREPKTAGSIKKEKTTSSATKLGQTLSGFDDEMSQSNGFNKKTANKTQMDLRSSWHGSSHETPKSRNRPSSAKKVAKDSREESTEKISPKTPQRVSLQMFVSKVNKGEAFSSIKNYGDKGNSSRKAQQKTNLTLEDKATKSVKAVDIDLKGSRTTPNVESKNYTVSLSKHITQVPMSSSLMTKSKAVNSKSGSSSATNKEQPKQAQEVAVIASSAQVRNAFVYYMTGLERAHSWDGESDYFVQIYREHFLQTYQALAFCKVLKPFEAHVLQQKKVNLPRRDTHKNKKTLIFDMDETLIHCNESPDVPCDVILPIVFPNGEVVEAGVNVRPYALEILKELSQVYEIVVFTASHACYANVVLDYLDPNEEYIHHRLFRDSCVVTEEGVHIKDLRVIGNRDLRDVILIDNAAYSFGMQIENGIPIIPFYDNKEDQELLHLIPYLKFLTSVNDLREINKQTFKLHMFGHYDTPEAVLERLILVQ